MTIDKIFEGNGWKATLEGKDTITISISQAGGNPMKIRNGICINPIESVRMTSSLIKLRDGVYHEIKTQIPESEHSRLENYGRPLEEFYQQNLSIDTI